MAASPSGWAGAPVAGDRIARARVASGLRHAAGATVQTGPRVTVQKWSLAIGPGVAGRARAGVQAFAGVEAGAAVEAGLVIRAIVEILVAEEPAPALVAQTLPGLLAATVKASGIPHALIAKGALPAVVTHALVGSIAVSVLFVASGQAARGGAVVAFPSG